MAQIWVADSEPNERFPLYTRGNVGEVFPRVMTALTGTLIGEAVQQGQTDLIHELGVLRPEEIEGPSVGTGVFAGYLYMNASAMRMFGVRMPGMKVADADEQVFGTIPDLPPYQRRPGDRNLRASLAIMRAGVQLMRRPDLEALERDRAESTAWLATMPDLETASDAELLEWLPTYPPKIAASMARLLRAGMLAALPRSGLEQLLARASAPAGMVNRIVGGTGDVDSALPARRLWALGRLVAEDPDLSAAFDAGLEGIAARTVGTPLDGAMADFLRDHGHRGPDEYELATPAWCMDPSPLYASIDRLRQAPADRDPIAAGVRLSADATTALAEAERLVARPARPILRRLAATARAGSVARERAKDILVLENLGPRLVLRELMRRAAERGGPTDARFAFGVTLDELEAFVAAPAGFHDRLTERAMLQAHLDARIPPMWFEGEIPDPSTWPRRADSKPVPPTSGTVLKGLAVQGGQASGPAKVIQDPGDPRGLEPGEVLVCAISDPSWTPLFLGAAAVVCDSGALQSHAAIVARELGLPAVMSVPGITSVADGTMLHVDGDTGEVRIG